MLSPLSVITSAIAFEFSLEYSLYTCLKPGVVIFVTFSLIFIFGISFLRTEAVSLRIRARSLPANPGEPVWYSSWPLPLSVF